MSLSHYATRASTPAEKRAVIERISAAWFRRPGMRLGEIIEEACRYSKLSVDDARLADLIENYVAGNGEQESPAPQRSGR